MLLATLARLVFPSWAFFDRLGEPAALELRPDGATAWLPAVVPVPRRWWHVVWHPAGTRTLAAQGVVERAVAEHDGRLPATAATAVQLERLAAALARPIGRCDWRLVVVRGDGTIATLRTGRVTPGTAS